MKKLIYVFALVGVFGFGANFVSAASVPSVTTFPATATSTSITMNGVFMSNGNQTTTLFEYSSNQNDLPAGTVGSGIIACQTLESASAGTFTCTLNTPNITAGTVYFLRAVASNINGTTYGNRISIQTTTVPPPSTTPTLTSISLASATQGQTFNINLFGTNFVSGASINFGSGATVNSVTFVSSSLLTANITLSSGATTGARNITVTSSGQTTGPQTFTVNPINNNTCGTLPTISSISPSSVTAGAGATSVTINGTNFVSGMSSSLFGGNTKTTNYINSTQIIMNLLASDVSSTGSISVLVANGSGCNSNNATFTINPVNNGGGGGGGGGGYYYYTVSVTTQSASNISSNSAILNGLVNPNGSTATSWFEYSTISNLSSFSETSHVAQGSANSNSSLIQSIVGLAPNTTYYFRAAANNSYGTVKGSISSFTTGNLNSIINTIQATNQTNTTAKLNGVFTNRNGNNAQGYFEYGTVASLGSTTVVQNLGTSAYANFSDTISNLTPGTIYYFRAVTVNQGSTYKGSILVFQTKGIGSATEETSTNNSTPSTVVTSQSSVLKITTTSDNIKVGDEIEYLVTYKNKNGVNLENTIISIQLPREVTFKESNFGKVNSDNIVELNAGLLVPNQVGSMTIKGKISSSASDKSVLVTTAIMTYNITGSTEKKDEIAYVTNHIVSGTGLEANSLFGASFLPSTLTEWLLLLLAILALTVVGRKLYSDYLVKAPKKVSTNGNADHINHLPM